MPEILHIPIGRVRRFAGQPRVAFDAAKMRELQASIDCVGQLVPALVRELPDTKPQQYELVDGERRWRACQALGLKTLKAEVIPIDNEAQQYAYSVAANFGSASHTPLEIAHAVRKLRDSGKTVAEVAAVFGKSTNWCRGYEKLLDLHASVLKLVEHPDPKKRLRIVHAQHIAMLPKPDQLKLAKEVVAKQSSLYATSQKVRALARKRGIDLDARARVASDEWTPLLRFVIRINRDVEAFLAWDTEFLERLLASRRYTDLVTLETLAESAGAELRAFTAKVADASRRVRAARGSKAGQTPSATGNGRKTATVRTSGELADESLRNRIHDLLASTGPQERKRLAIKLSITPDILNRVTNHPWFIRDTQTIGIA